MFHVSIRKDMGYLKRELADLFVLVILGATIMMPITVFFLPVIKYVIGDIARWIPLGHISFVVGSFLTLGFYISWKQWRCSHIHKSGVSGGGYGYNDGLPWSGTECLDCGVILNYEVEN